ncbi:MAG: class I SAM-dependent methyltransferase [Alphaproteobacteria bacterium]|nr:class I SAM-dependent methyltransferase [Alphaproteobacteria bacterium]
MSFSADWLALRTPFDAAARDVGLERHLAAWAAARTAETGQPLAVIDLGAGSGNNYRHLAPRLGVMQHWTLLDSDRGLLRLAPDRVDTQLCNLAAGPEAAIPDGVDLVTASALIDLVSEPWLAALLARAEAVGAALFVVLSYDGRIAWETEHAADARVVELVNRHQRGDKGFGPALGPTAGDALRRLSDRPVLEARSDWLIGSGDTAMRAALVEGWRSAAAEIAPDESSALNAWAEAARLRAETVVVGHVDQLILQ